MVGFGFSGQRPAATRRPGSFPRRGEQGLSLVEVLISLAVLAIIMAPLAMSFISGLRTTRAAEVLLGESRSAQQIASLWTRDVQNVEPGGVNTQEECPATDPADPALPESLLVTFSWGSATTASTPESATWVVVGTGTNAKVERRACSAGQPTTTMTVADSFGLSEEDPSSVIRGPVPAQPRQFCPLDADGVGRTCTIVVDGRYSYHLSVDRRVPDATNAILPDTPPAAPEITLAEPRQERINVGWTVPPQAPGQSAVVAYRLFLYDSPTGEPIASEELTETEYAFTGLTNGTEYWLRVQARNEVGWGPLSAVVGPVVPTNSSPEAPTITGVSPGDTEVTATWTPNPNDGGSPVTQWKIYAYTDAGGEVGHVIVAAGGGGTESGTIGDLLNASDYRIRVAGINALGEGPMSAPSDLVRPYGIPGQATIIGLTANPDGTIELDWNEPTTNPPNSTATDGGRPVTGYVIRAVTGSPSGPWPSTGLLPESTRSYTVTGLTIGQTYSFVVETHNPRGFSTSEPSASGVSATPPGMPRDVQATVNGTSQVLLTWNPPLSDGGSPITGYKVQRTGGSVVTLGPGASSYNFTGLASGGSYTFSVWAVNAQGDGPAASANQTAQGAPGAVSVGVQRQAGNTYPFAVNISWAPPSNKGGGCIKEYRIEYSTNGSTVFDSQTLSATPNPVPPCGTEPATSLAWTGLPAGVQTRYFRVVTTNTANLTSTSSWASISMTQLCTVPVTEDTYSDDRNPLFGTDQRGRQHGDWNYMEVNKDRMNMFLKFNPRADGSNCSQFGDQLPAAAVSLSGAVRAHIYEPTSWCRDHQIYLVTGNWSETGLTHNNQPGYTGGGGSVCSDSGGYKSFSVSTAQINQQRTGNRYGWTVRDTGGNIFSTYAYYTPRERNGNESPRLDVWFY